MEHINCYKTVKEIVDTAGKEFRNSYQINQDKYQELEDICASIDLFAKEIDCSCVDASVNMESHRLSIGISCDDVVFQKGRTHKFFSLIAMLDSFSFSKSKNGTLWIEFNIDSLWERVSE